MGLAAAEEIAAVFDVDNTLLPGTSSERLFILYVVRQRYLGPRAALATLQVMARHARRGPFYALRHHRPYLRGWRLADLERLGEEAVQATIVPRLSARAVATVRRHQALGHLLALLSGSLPFLLAPLARHLGIAQIIATPLALDAGVYTGELAGNHPYGRQKAILAHQFAREHGVDLAASFAYADHHSDASFLALFGHPVCVNPTARLRRLAARNGWPVQDWRHSLSASADLLSASRGRGVVDS